MFGSAVPEPIVDGSRLDLRGDNIGGVVASCNGVAPVVAWD